MRQVSAPSLTHRRSARSGWSSRLHPGRTTVTNAGLGTGRKKLTVCAWGPQSCTELSERYFRSRTLGACANPAEAASTPREKTRLASHGLRVTPHLPPAASQSSVRSDPLLPSRHKCARPSRAVETAAFESSPNGLTYCSGETAKSLEFYRHLLMKTRFT